MHTGAKIGTRKSGYGIDGVIFFGHDGDLCGSDFV